MFRCSILAIFGLLLPLSAQVAAEPAGSGHTAAATGKRVRSRCSTSEADDLMTRVVPHPYVYVAPSLMPAGYAFGAIRSEGGLNVESCHLVASGGAAYDNGRAARDNGPPNPKGHDRYLDGKIDFRPNWFSDGIFFGAGWRWSQHSTTNYTKGGNRPQFGGGYDLIQRPCPTCRSDFSMRIEGNWFTAGNDRQDGSHGLEISMSIPSPRERRHLFYEERMAIFSFHETVPASDNTPLAVSARAHRSLTCSVNFGILYRF